MYNSGRVKSASVTILRFPCFKTFSTLHCCQSHWEAFPQLEMEPTTEGSVLTFYDL